MLGGLGKERRGLVRIEIGSENAVKHACGHVQPGGSIQVSLVKPGVKVDNLQFGRAPASVAGDSLCLELGRAQVGQAALPIQKIGFDVGPPGPVSALSLALSHRMGEGRERGTGGDRLQMGRESNVGGAPPLAFGCLTLDLTLAAERNCVSLCLNPSDVSD